MAESSAHDNPEVILGVVGVGYVGLTTGACLAVLGHRVVCGDIDADRVERLRAGVIPIVEEGLQPLVAEGIASGRLTFEVGAAAVAEQASIVFLCVPTPQDADGSADLSYVQAAAAEIAPVLAPGSVVVNKSTVPVGSTHVVSAVLRRGDVSVVSNPEFLREGTAVHDFLHPDRVVVGSADRAAAHRVADLYRTLDTRVLVTDAASAETIKYAANGFLAMKLAFVNQLADLCEVIGANISEVVHGIGLDARIGTGYLTPGPGWGGSCFPKDSRAVVQIARQEGFDFSLMASVIEANERHIRHMVDKIERSVSTGIQGARIALLGLTFKAGTDDLRESPSLRIAQQIMERGGVVAAYDPTCRGVLSAQQKTALGQVTVCDTVEQAVEGADLLVVATEWPEFKECDFAHLASCVRTRRIVDLRNLLEPEQVVTHGFEYLGLGR